MGKYEEMKEKYPRGMIVFQGFWMLFFSTVISLILISPFYIFNVSTQVIVEVFTWPQYLIPEPYNFIGLVLVTIGFILIVWANYALLVTGKLSLRNREPMQKPERLVISGPFRFSRNPLYLGALLAMIGLSIMWSSIVTAFFTILVYIIFRNFFIKKEEIILEEEFGDEYRNFKKRVRRWL